ncbi:MAG: AAA family ATPase, partial [Terriglobales bacterium]
MILNLITLHNFMSYADATLDFSNVSVACLAGPNGAGKSALLDAITWALWEEARAGSDDLVRLGEREMWVDLAFSHEGQRYRVRRSRQKSAGKSGTKGTSKGGLEFQIWNRRENEYADLSSTAEESFATAVGAAVSSGSLGDDGARTGRHSAGILTQTREDEPGHWKSLTAASMRETQEAICALLRMDFDTFINS